MKLNSTFKNFKGKMVSAVAVVLFTSLFTGLAFGQTFMNGNLSTGATTSTGTAAPAGFTWSQLQLTNNSLGYAASIAAGAGFTVADDFTVPAGPSWNLTMATFYAYSTNYAGATSPFNDVRVQIYNTNPSVGSPTPIFGDLNTNRIAASSTASMYRTAATASTARQIWKIDANISVTLAPGTYWIEWQVGNGGLSNFSPPSTVVGTTTQPGNNAIQRTLSSSTWAALTDVGGPQAMPFMLSYTTGACAGTPAPGNALTSSAVVCPATPFSLTLQNATPGSGVTYQWQSSPDSTVWTNITGATSPSYSVASLAATTFYRAQVTCSGQTGTSAGVKVSLNPPSACYCAAGATSTSFEKISRVQFGTINRSSTSTAGYENFITDTTNVVRQSTTPITVTISGAFAADRVLVWIDFNQNGNFTDAGELVYTSATGVGPHTGNITIPITANLGYTRMRVRMHDTSLGANATPCGNSTYGQVEDYTVNIVPCVPGVFTTQPVNRSIMCGTGTTFSAAASGSAITYRWQVRTSATGIWQNIANGGIYSGATTGTLTLTDASTNVNGYQYRAVIDGPCTGTDFSSAVTLTITPLIATVSPTSAAICRGSVQQLSLTNTVAAAQTSTFIATGLPVAIPDNTFPITTATAIPITVSGIPAGSVIQNIGVRFTIPHTYVGDVIMNLNAPNGQNINLFALLNGGAGNNATANFTNTTIDSTSTANISGAAAPRSGTYRAEKFSISNPDFGDMVVTNTSWSALTGTLNGTWNIKVADLGPGDVGTVTALSLFITYTAPNFAQGVWAGPDSIFTNAAATIPYVAGSLATSVYVKPTATGVNNYTVSFATATCQSAVTTIPVTVSAPITGTSTTTNKAVCVGGNTSFTATAPTGGSPLMHQWKVSTDAGATFTNITNGGVYSGATTSTLSITGAMAAMNGYRYKDSLYVTACGSFVNTNAATLTVNPNPVVVLTANPFTALYPGQTTTLSAAVSPNPGATYTWLRNGVIVPGATANTLVVDVDALGVYTVNVNDVNGCGGSSTTSIEIKSAANDILFIYPSPNSGQFQVRYFSQPGNNPLPRVVNIYDSKGARVYSKRYTVTVPYTRLDVNLTNYQRGLYSVELTDGSGVRLKVGRVLIQ